MIRSLTFHHRLRKLSVQSRANFFQPYFIGFHFLLRTDGNHLQPLQYANETIHTSIPQEYFAISVLFHAQNSFQLAKERNLEAATSLWPSQWKGKCKGKINRNYMRAVF
jgi:hypothetical protein